MSTIILQAAGSFVGGVIGGPVGAVVGQAIGAAAGAAIDSAIISAITPARRIEGPRLKTVSGLSSTEGAAVPRVYGRVRIGGELIWATRFRESSSVQKTGGGGKGAGGGQKAKTTTYSYTANIAVGLCEGPIAFVRRVWADGRELDLTTIVMRVYTGSETQQPDPLITAKEGAARTPAYRGLAYVVFENLPLANFGNRVPQLSFEVVKPCGSLGPAIRAINLIPGAGEFVCQHSPVMRSVFFTRTTPENRHVLTHTTDFAASLDQLLALCPNLQSVGLVVTWFGDDLRAGACTVAPRVEVTKRATRGAVWTVSGIARAQARMVSRVDGRPAFGGTPSDVSVIEAIRVLKARGLKVMLYPFIMMDVAAGNALPDPWSGRATQPVYPWRGRITCHPAPGQPGSPDATMEAARQVSSFIGSVPREAFSLAGDTVLCASGEWSLRRQVLHYAMLARAAGGVDAMLIGSELVGLTRVRSSSGIYPAAQLLANLASDVRAILGPATRLSYAADWTEYGSHAPQPGELRFPLDPLWASPSIDAVGIDAYWPMADWRDGPLHADAAIAASPYDPSYLRANQAAGEGFDWYYASPQARQAQIRTPITDGAAGKPWVWRPKDLVGWWQNAHVERVGGVELLAPTAWRAMGKPIWLTEIGCPAVDKGANGPNTFPDPKSSEDSLPPFSSGGRDDLMQARTVEAVLTRFDPALPGHPAGANPISPVYGGRMVDPARTHVWAWDARPFPAFPTQTGVWADGPAWDLGHWLTGRLEGMTVDRLVATILAEFGAPAANQFAVDGFLDGYVLDQPMSARAALEPLAALFGYDAIASGGALRFASRTVRNITTISADDLVPDREGALARISRAQSTELPRALALNFVDAEGDYARATVSSRRIDGVSRRETALDIPAVLPRDMALRLIDTVLQAAWAARETVTATLRPGLLALEVGDVIMLPDQAGARPFRISRIRDAGQREIEASSVGVATGGGGGRATPRASVQPPALAGPPVVIPVDWPFANAASPVLQSLAITASPWPASMAIWRSVDGASFDPFGIADAPAGVGMTLADFGPGPLWRWDNASALVVELSDTSLATRGDGDALAGTSTLALQGPDGAWEMIAFARAELIGTRRWRLTRLLRGLGGSEQVVARAVPAESLVVLLDSRLVAVASGADMLGQTWRYRVGPADADIADATVTRLEATPGATALRPLAPVRIRARRSEAGLALSWLRRGRIGADGWEPLDIPLDEVSERYELDILSGSAASATVLRTLKSETPFVLYDAGSELADFGTRQDQITLRVAMLSAVVGRGTARTVTLRV